jgi:hypothetical protein
VRSRTHRPYYYRFIYSQVLQISSFLQFLLIVRHWRLGADLDWVQREFVTYDPRPADTLPACRMQAAVHSHFFFVDLATHKVQEVNTLNGATAACPSVCSVSETVGQNS